MPEGEKPVESPVTGGEAKSIPLADFITFKKASTERERKLKAQLEESNQRYGSLESELRIAKANGNDDEDVKEVKAYLLKQQAEIDAAREKLNKEVATHQEREKVARVKELAQQYGIDASEIESEDDPEKTALRLYVEKLTKEKEVKDKEPAKTPVPARIYESGSPSLVKKMPKDMNDKELADYEKDLKAKALS